MSVLLACVIAGQFPMAAAVPPPSAVVQDLSEFVTNRTTCEKLGAEKSGAFTRIDPKFVRCDHDPWPKMVRFYCATWEGNAHLAMMTSEIGK